MEVTLKEVTFTKAFVCTNIINAEEQINDWLRVFKDDIVKVKDIKLIADNNVEEYSTNYLNALIIYTIAK